MKKDQINSDSQVITVPNSTLNFKGEFLDLEEGNYTVHTTAIVGPDSWE